ncbi:hypothetical protein V6N13_108076 [Hibiscus sabdariffa]|uniref:RING-type domain-containing protein n=1 Tax=Hibiscus sabdariffa TaxID=183260 RepID=A0ABR2SR58_9ROSI
MGSKISKGYSRRRSRTSRSCGTASLSPYGYGYPTPQHPSYGLSPLHNYRSQMPRHVHKTVERRYSRIADNYQTLDHVTAALAQAGLESSNLIVGINFTKSNEWTGAMSFNCRSLHQIGKDQNPYEQAISIIGQSLSAFDEDNLIPLLWIWRWKRDFAKDSRRCSHDTEKSFLNFDSQDQHLLHPSLKWRRLLSRKVVTRSVDTQHVGVGDGPWDMMRKFDDNIPARAFDNFQFVNFTEIMSKMMIPSRKQAEFALSALMEIPSQCKATIVLGLLGRKKGNTSESFALPPPIYGPSSFYTPSPYSGYHTAATSATAPSSAPFYDHQVHHSDDNNMVVYYVDSSVCPICISNPKDMAFGCGHQTCCDCGEDLQLCPICRTTIQTRIRRLY